MTVSGRDSECPCRKGPEDIPSRVNVQGLKVGDTTEDSYLSLTFGLLLYTFPSLTGSCATIDYMHRSIPEIIKVESELVIFLDKSLIPGKIMAAGLVSMNRGPCFITGWRRDEDEKPGQGHLFTQH